MYGRNWQGKANRTEEGGYIAVNISCKENLKENSGELLEAFYYQARSIHRVIQNIGLGYK